MSDRRKQIKKRLREIKHDPASAGPGEVQRLTAEYVRLSRPRRSPAAGTAPEPSADPEAAAVETWPMELRARLHRSAASRVIDGSTLDDPESWGVKNDLRRRGARP